MDDEYIDRLYQEKIYEMHVKRERQEAKEIYATIKELAGYEYNDFNATYALLACQSAIRYANTG